jgi:hypothetical protein
MSDKLNTQPLQGQSPLGVLSLGMENRFSSSQIYEPLSNFLPEKNATPFTEILDFPEKRT